MIRGLANFFLIFTVLYLFLSFNAYAGPFASFPGSKARALAGSFTSMADDPSAVWYNPAGIADNEHDVVFETTQALTIDSKDGPLEVSQVSFFAGGSLDTEYGDIGLFFYSPYTPKYWSYDTGDRKSSWGHIHEVMQVISIPYALSFFEERFKLGLSLEYVNIKIDDSNIFYRDLYGNTQKYDLNKDSAASFSGSIGMIFKFIDNDETELSTGLTYRLGSYTDIGKKLISPEDSTSSASKLVYEKPQSFDIGLSYKMMFPTSESLAGSLSYSLTDWGSARSGGSDFKYSKYSIGGEYQFKNQLKNLKIKSFRLGYYFSNADNDSNTFGKPEVSGLTWGLGLTIGDISEALYRCDNLTFEIAQELRMQKSDTGDGSEVLTSLMINWSM